MKIEIEFEDDDNVFLTIDGQKMTVERDGAVSTLKGVPDGLEENSLGGLIALCLFSKITDIASVLDDEASEYFDRLWEELPGDIADEVYNRIV